MAASETYRMVETGIQKAVEVGPLRVNALGNGSHFWCVEIQTLHFTGRIKHPVPVPVPTLTSTAGWRFLFRLVPDC